MEGWFTDIGGDKLGDCCEVGFLFLFRSGERDQDVKIWGVSSGVTSKFEAGFKGFFFIGSSVDGAPMASIRGSFLVKDTESVSDRCWSFDDKVIVFLVGESPLQGFEIKVNGDKE